jgi:hypothetical protein
VILIKARLFPYRFTFSARFLSDSILTLMKPVLPMTSNLLIRRGTRSDLQRATPTHCRRFERRERLAKQLGGTFLRKTQDLNDKRLISFDARLGRSSGEERLAMQNVLAAGSSRNESKWRRKDGLPVFIGISAGAIHHKDGIVDCVLCSKRIPISSDFLTPQSSKRRQYFAVPELPGESRKLLKKPAGILVFAASKKDLSLRPRLQDEAMTAAIRPAALRQFFIVLLSDTTKCTNHGDMSITLKQTMAKRQRLSEIVVFDVSTGITPNDKNRLLEANTQFRRIPPPRPRDTGPNSHLSQRLVTLSGRRLPCPSSLGKSACIFAAQRPALN